MTYFIASTILFIPALIIIYWVHNQYHLDIVVAPAAPPPADPPLISICIPARNEENNIRTCVESALEQDYPRLEVIVVDDRSTDATPGILRSLRMQSDSSLSKKKGQTAPLKIIHGSELLPGWAGKPHALHQAAAVAHGEWLCFVDADTFLAPQAISACYAKAIECDADLFTTLHHQLTVTFWEKAVMPLIMTALSVGFPPRKVNDPRRREAVANGQFILIRRGVYDSIGGHAHIKDQIVEDKAISEQVKWNGHRLIIADARRFISTRMYTSLESMWEGWTKNIYLGLRDHPFMLLLGACGAALALIAALFLPAWLVLGMIWYFKDGGPFAVGVLMQSLIVWGALLLARAKVARKMKINPLYAFTTPLGAGIFAAMMLASAWKVISGQGVTWRGRIYRPEKRKARV